MDTQDMEREAAEWLKLNVVHRGQWCGSDRLRTDLAAFSFGTREAAEQYSQSPNNCSLASSATLSPRVFTARLNASKVYCRTGLKHADPFFDLDDIALDFGRDVARSVMKACRISIMQTGGFDTLSSETGMSLEEMMESWPDNPTFLPPVLAYLAMDIPEFVSALHDKGYDAVAFGGSGETARQMEWHIFDADMAIDLQTRRAIGADARSGREDQELEP